MSHLEERERFRLNHVKAALVSYAQDHDDKNGGYTAIQAVQKMAGFSSIKDYVLALADGLKYGNWPWTTYKDNKSDEVRKDEHLRTCDLVGYRQGYNAPPVCSCGLDKNGGRE